MNRREAFKSLLGLIGLGAIAKKATAAAPTCGYTSSLAVANLTQNEIRELRRKILKCYTGPCQRPLIIDGSIQVVGFENKPSEL